MDHELGKERGMRPSFPFISYRPGHPVLDLKDQPVNNMDDKSTEQRKFHDLDQRVCCHEIRRFPEYFLMISRDRDDKKIDTKVYYQEYHEKCPRESHDEFFG
jgi:hypothetical protein